MGNIPSLPFKRYIILKFPCGDRFFKYIVMVDYLKIWETCVRIGPNNQETGPAIGG